MHSHAKPFIPAAGRDFLLPLYDPLTRLLGADRLRGRLVERAAIRPGERVLDLGAGTGGLTVVVKRRHPDAAVVGIDPDPKALARARAKAAAAGLEIDFREGYGDALPFGDGSFQRVVSSLVLHHLTTPVKEAALQEVKRVLAPGGTLHVLDFGPPRGFLQRTLTRLLHGDDELGDNIGGRIPELMQRAGFDGAREVAYWPTPFGTVSLFEGERAVA
jgi:ubiquinone/menaquinone biosynthesis C-methylase UbiE